MGKAFNGDIYIKDEFYLLVAKYKINTIIETGTYKGDTTFELLNMVPEVHTIESNQMYFNEAVDILNKDLENDKRLDGLHFHYGSSPEILSKILRDVKEPVLFFLDAHLDRYN